MSYPQTCPFCEASMLEPELINGEQYYRCIGIEDPEIYDGIICWRCPDCDGEWPSEVGKIIARERNTPITKRRP